MGLSAGELICETIFALVNSVGLSVGGLSAGGLICGTLRYSITSLHSDSLKDQFLRNFKKRLKIIHDGVHV